MTSLYSGVGEELTQYRVDLDDATLSRSAAVTLPANVQYAWPHPSKRYLYVVSSNGGPRAAGDRHYASAFQIDATGALHPHGALQPLPSRPLHISVDASGSLAMIAYNIPGRVTVHRIDPDGTFGPEVKQAETLDVGVFPHQILMMPSNRTAILVTRGNDAGGGKPEDPGALKLLDVHGGVLTNKTSIAPGGGYGFGPRHLDFHPTRPWVYVALERQNQLHMYTRDGDDLARKPAFVRDTLVEPDNVRPWQMAGTIHVHPNGQFVYVANRASFTVEFEGIRVFGGGENTIVVYAIDQATGEPTPIQSVETRGFHVRTFALDASGRMLVAASLLPLRVRKATRVVTVAAGLSVFRVGADGRLDFVRKYDVETGGKTQFWMGIV
jgi:6-phosphogluconolactonase